MTGRLFYHQQEIQPAPAAQDTRFQDALLDTLHDLTGVPLPAA